MSDLPVSDPPPQTEGIEVTTTKYGLVVNISRELAIDHGLIQPTGAERAERAEQSARWAAERDAERAQPGPPLTLDALLGYLGISPEYAAHLLHPGCYCAPFGDDPRVCDWARDLGLAVEH